MLAVRFEDDRELIEQPLRRLRERRIPVVAYGDEPELAQQDRVFSDHELGGYMLTRWLIEQRGCRRILPLAGASANLPTWFNRRYEGYQRAMRETGLEPMPPVQVPTLPWSQRTTSLAEHTRARAHFLAGHMLPPFTGQNAPVDAVMCTSDGEAYAANMAVELLRSINPNPVTVVGYDNYWRECPERELFPQQGPAASVDKKNDQMGRKMVELLMARRAGELPDAPQAWAIEPELVINPER